MGESLELFLLLITSGIPGFYTYYALSSKNIIYFNTDNKNVILSFFSIISILIFLLILSLFSGINSVNNLFENLTFTIISLSLIVSSVIVMLLTEIAYPLLLNFYNYFNNKDRAKSGLNNTESLPIHLSRYEDSNYKMFIIVKTFEGVFIEMGFLDDYSRKSNRNILLNTRFNDNYYSFIDLSNKKDCFIDFENNVKLEYYYIDKEFIFS
ncbi:Uncharacterised protein [Mammaliicoccus lentus]|nr:Uncharacterised protein [Mammaliicoccus lentus]